METDQQYINLINSKRTYRFISKYVLYYNGEAHVFNVGDLINLAGLELSTYSNKSPFHFKNDIVRIPNSVVEKI